MNRNQTRHLSKRFPDPLEKSVIKLQRLQERLERGDMNIFGRAVKIPVVTYGPGDPTQSHTESECIEIKEFLDWIEVYRRAISRLIRMHGEKRDIS
ncbi:MAG: hypothetical protein ACUVTE_05245 [Candidatus Bathycorpusculaceae bacterium]